MVMTNEEIVRSYREAANRIKQIAILADLNVCKQGKICTILLDAGEELPKKRGGWKIPQNVDKDAAAPEAPDSDLTVEENDDYNVETVEIVTEPDQTEEPDEITNHEFDAPDDGLRYDIIRNAFTLFDSGRDERRNRTTSTVDVLIDALEIYREKGRRNADQMKKELYELRKWSERIEARLKNVNAVCDTISRMIGEVRGHE